jgi:hypothetical protein
MKTSSMILTAATAMITLAASLGAGCTPRRTPPPDPALVLAAVGDIADCAHNGGVDATHTAELLKGHPGVPILVAGDIAYEDGNPEQFANCYDKHWGFLKDRIHPAPGNHEYGIYEIRKEEKTTRNDAEPYFAYFGASAGPAGLGFYSFDIGAWHIVSLNSMAGVEAGTPTRPVKAPSMAEQLAWLDKDLGNTRTACILAFWHHPLFSSGEHGHQAGDPGRKVGPLWEALARHGADVIINGHDHHYERFALQTAAGQADDEHGIREFVVGTGGAAFRPFLAGGPAVLARNSEFVLDRETDHGVLLLQLHPDSYEWKFVKPGGSIWDPSQRPQACHPKTPR